MAHPLMQRLKARRGTALLFAVEMACTIAVVANSAAIVVAQTRLSRMESGIDETVVITADVDEVGHSTGRSHVAEDAAAMEAIPGVMQVVPLEGAPFGGDWTTTLSSNPDLQGSRTSASVMQAGSGLVSTLGLQLSQGRGFATDEYATATETAHHCLVTAQLAKRMFGGRSPLGRSIFMAPDQPLRIVGVVEHLMRPRPSAATLQDNELVVILPVNLSSTQTTYALRTRSGATQSVGNAIPAALARVGHDHVVAKIATVGESRARYFESADADAHLLLCASLALILVGFSGLAGLASFFIDGNQRAIGIMRALGSTRTRVTLEMLLEIMIPALAGALAGFWLALALNRILLETFESASLPIAYPTTACVLAVALAAIAAAVPALSAARMPPTSAIRGG